MSWVGRLFDARDTLVRMVLLDLSGVAYLVFGTQAGRSPTATQWVLAVVAFAVALVFHRRPVVNLLGQIALLAVAICVHRRHDDQPGGRQLGAARGGHVGAPATDHLAGRRHCWPWST